MRRRAKKFLTGAARSCRNRRSALVVSLQGAQLRRQTGNEEEITPMAEHGKSRETSAPADKVWAIWTDTATWGQWNPNVTTMDMPPPVALGKEGVMNTPAGQHHQMKVVEFEPGRSFTLETSVIPLSRFRFTCKVEPAADKTQVSQSVKVV